MKLIAQQATLMQGLNMVSKAVSARSTLPVLGNVLLEANKESGLLKMAATNLEIAVVVWLPANIEKDGAVTIPAKLLSEFVGQLPDHVVVMELKQKQMELVISCSPYIATIKGIDAQEFPMIVTETEEGRVVRVSPWELEDAVKGVAFAAATDESRPTLTGVYMGMDGESITLATTDGFRLAVRGLEAEKGVDGKHVVLVPARSMSEVARIVGLYPDKEQGEMEITFREKRNQAIFSMPRVSVVTQLIDANYPNFRAIVPSKYGTSVELDGKDLSRALRVANLFARDSSNIVRIEVEEKREDGSGNKVIVRAISAESGDNESVIDAIVEGPSMEIAFNGRYLVDAVGAIGDGKIRIELSKANAPGVIRPAVSGESEVMYLTMPMHYDRKGATK